MLLASTLYSVSVTCGFLLACLDLRVVTKHELTECVIAKKDISVLDRKNWSNLSQLVLPGSKQYCYFDIEYFDST